MENDEVGSKERAAMAATIEEWKDTALFKAWCQSMTCLGLKPKPSNLNAYIDGYTVFLTTLRSKLCAENVLPFGHEDLKKLMGHGPEVALENYKDNSLKTVNVLDPIEMINAWGKAAESFPANTKILMVDILDAIRLRPFVERPVKKRKPKLALSKSEMARREKLLKDLATIVGPDDTNLKKLTTKLGAAK
jgi:hypothetical protein